MNLQDTAVEHPLSASRTIAQTPVLSLVEESFRLGAAGEDLTRVFVRHPSAVAVLAVDDSDRVLLINQYRHPVRMRLWEVPAGLLDVEGESLWATAQRELYEEADLEADTWHTLVDFYTTPGSQDEAIRVFLAEGVTEVATHRRHTRKAEEAEIRSTWVPLEEAVSAVLNGQLHNPSAAMAVLALHAVRSGAGELREPRSGWADHPRGTAP